MLRIGLMVTLEWTKAEDNGRNLKDLLEHVRTARDAGFQSIWVTQHFLVGPGMRQLQTIPLLGRIAAEAEGMTLGTGVLLLPLMNPVIVAEELATLDHITGGRFILGTGIGYRDHEFAAIGVPRRERVPRFVEYIEVMRRLWAEDTVTHKGRFVTLNDDGIGLRPANGRIPVWIGATVEAAVKRAAEIGDSWIGAAASTTAEFKQWWDVFHAARRAAGRSLDYPRMIAREAYVGPDMASAMATARGPIMGKYERYAAHGFGGFDGTEAGFASFAKDRFLIGDPAYVKDELQRQKEITGATEFRFRMQWPGLSQPDTLASIRRMGAIAASL